jgi:hypothetical protein
MISTHHARCGDHRAHTHLCACTSSIM